MLVSYRRKIGGVNSYTIPNTTPKQCEPTQLRAFSMGAFLLPFDNPLTFAFTLALKQSKTVLYKATVVNAENSIG